MSNDKDKTWWKVTLGQGGNKLIANLDDEQWGILSDALFQRGVICTMMIAENNVLRGITVVPRQGGIVFNIEAATPVLIMNGQLATAQEIATFQAQYHQTHPGHPVPQPHRIEPWEQPRAKIVFPAWSLSVSATVIDSPDESSMRVQADKAAPPRRPPPKPTTPSGLANGAAVTPAAAKPAKRTPPAPPPEAS